MNEISTIDEALVAVKKIGSSLNKLHPKLKHDVSFVWALSRIQSDTADEIRKKYVYRFFIQESLKLFVSLASVTISSLLIAGVFILPIPSLAVLIVGSLFASLSSLYATNKLYQHAQGFLKSKAVVSPAPVLDTFFNLPVKMIQDPTQQHLYAANNLYQQRVQDFWKPKGVVSPAPVLDALSALPAENEQPNLGSLPLPNELILEIKERLHPQDIKNLGSVSRRMYGLFQVDRLHDKFLEYVAFGMQDKVEQLFTDVYAGNADTIQEALRYRGRFTDYSGRTFNSDRKFKYTAYEYAYWAKDTHMCRMLERYMDDKTKAFMLARIDANEANGLIYQQNGTEHRSAHFDFTPLIQALQFYVNNYDAWDIDIENGPNAMAGAWMNVGLAQRDVPAHVAQEYCRPDRSFRPIPQFNEATLPRLLTFKNIAHQNGSWFPLKGADSGLGFEVGVTRGWFEDCPRDVSRRYVDKMSGLIEIDLAAITRLYAVRTADLTLSREHLNPPAVSPAM